MFSVFGPLVLVLIPFACLVFSSPAKRALPVMAGALGMVVALAGATRSGLWYVERGWTIILGGCFAAVTLRWPERKFLPRALLALAISGAGAWAALGLSPRRWAIIDQMVAARLRDGVSTSLEALRVLRDGTPLPGTVITTVFQAAEWQSNLFPAMLGLSSLAALGTAWWLYDRLVRRRIAKSSTCHLLPLTSGATLFLAVATGFAETPADDLEAALAGELDEAGDLDADEVARSVVGAETRNLRGLQQLEWRADLLSMYATHFGDAGRLNRDLRRLRRVTVDEVREWSRNYLRPGNRAVVRYLPEAPS